MCSMVPYRYDPFSLIFNQFEWNTFVVELLLDWYVDDYYAWNK